MTPLDILQPHCKDGVFNDYIIQMFVETNNVFNYTFFNKFHDTSFTHSVINTAILELTGSKAVKFHDVDNLPGLVQFKLHYKFGKFPNVRGWIDHMYANYGEVNSRQSILKWVATQRPDKAVSSFLPANDRNMYNDVREEKSS